MTLCEKSFGPVRFIPGPNSGKYPYCHSVYIEGAGILIDPASDRERLTALKNGPGVTEIWLSHWHEDHFMHLDLFEDVPLCIAEPDAQPLTDLDVLMDAYGVNEKYRGEWRPLFKDVFHFQPRQADRHFPIGQSMKVDGLTVDFLPTPGHTPGHTAFFFREPGVLFLGDYDLSDFGPWYGDRDSDIEKTIQSVRMLQAVDASVWLAAHEIGIFEQNPDSRWEQYLDVIHQREEKLLTLLESPRTLEEIVAACIVYGRPREPKMFFEFGEEALMKKHLERLAANGRASFDGQRYRRLGNE